MVEENHDLSFLFFSQFYQISSQLHLIWPVLELLDFFNYFTIVVLTAAWSLHLTTKPYLVKFSHHGAVGRASA